MASTVKTNDQVIYTGASTRKWNGIVLAVDEVTNQIAVRWTSFGPGLERVKFQVTPLAEVEIGQHLMKDLEKKAEAKPTPAPKKAPAKAAEKK